MPTIIDALVVTLGMDSSGFKKGTRDVDESLDKTRKGTDRTAKEIEASGIRAAQFVNRLKAEFIGLFATITAGKGIANFVSDSISGTAALGRMAANLNMSARELDGWGRAAETVGGTAEGMRNSLQGIAAGIQEFALTGNTAFLPALRTLGVGLDDGTGKVRDYRDIMFDLADKLRAMSPQEAIFFGKQFGFDEGTVNLMRKGGQAVRDLTNEFAWASGVTEKSVQASQRMESQLALFRQRMAGVGQTLYESMGPGLELVIADLGKLSAWLNDHRDDISQAITDGVHAVEELVSAFHELNEATDGNAGKVALATAGLWALVTVLGAVAAGMRTVVGLGAATGGALLRAVPPALAGAAGWELGGWLNKRFIEPNADLSNTIGEWTARGMAALGSKEAQEALDINSGKRPAPVSSAPPPLQVTRGRSDGPRGIRNNNPGNLNFAGQAGATKETGPNGRFAVFGSMEEGIAALIKQLQRYMSRGIDTIRELVNTYAPASENDTGAYMKALSQSLGIGLDDKLDLSNQQQLFALLRGIINHENGAGQVTGAQILRGIQVGAAASPSGRPIAGNSNSVQSETNIQTLNVVTQATDAQGVARGIGDALADRQKLLNGPGDG